jgi:phosphoribosylglycinamide formyltransferase-1
MRIGAIGNSGGSYFAEAYRILKNSTFKNVQYYAVLDRQCGFESFCQEKNIEHRRIDVEDRKEFSLMAKTYFDSCGGVDFVILFFSRLVTKELFLHYPTFNIHPSLLPAFKGNNAVTQARDARVKFLGTTLHLVDKGLDTGPILAQTNWPILPAESLERLNTYSFIQKVYLLLVLVEAASTKSFRIINQNSNIEMLYELPFTDRYNPCLRDDFLRKKIHELCKDQVGGDKHHVF